MRFNFNREQKIFLVFIGSIIMTFIGIFLLSIIYNLLFVEGEAGKDPIGFFSCSYAYITRKCSFTDYTELFFEPLYIILWSPVVVILATIETAFILKKK